MTRDDLVVAIDAREPALRLLECWRLRHGEALAHAGRRPFNPLVPILLDVLAVTALPDGPDSAVFVALGKAFYDAEHPFMLVWLALQEMERVARREEAKERRAAARRAAPRAGRRVPR